MYSELRTVPYFGNVDTVDFIFNSELARGEISFS